jgi:hypothetical protein
VLLLLPDSLPLLLLAVLLLLPAAAARPWLKL